MSDEAKRRLEELRGELRAERISYGEMAELQSLAPYIDAGDVELREAAGVPEFRCECDDGVVPGALWPWMPDGDSSHPWVERCDACGRFPDDEAAAEAVAAKVGRPVEWAEVGRVPGRRSPYVALCRYAVAVVFTTFAPDGEAAYESITRVLDEAMLSERDCRASVMTEFATGPMIVPGEPDDFDIPEVYMRGRSLLRAEA